MAICGGENKIPNARCGDVGSSRLPGALTSFCEIGEAVREDPLSAGCLGHNFVDGPCFGGCYGLDVLRGHAPESRLQFSSLTDDNASVPEAGNAIHDGVNLRSVDVPREAGRVDTRLQGLDPLESLLFVALLDKNPGCSDTTSLPELGVCMGESDGGVGMLGLQWQERGSPQGAAGVAVLHGAVFREAQSAFGIIRPVGRFDRGASGLWPLFVRHG